MKKLVGSFSFGEILLWGYSLIFARSFFVPFHKLLFHVSVRGLGVFNYQSFSVSGERYLIRKLLPQLLYSSSLPVMFDIGANEGDFSSGLVAMFPQATVYSFEPHGKTFDRLHTRLGVRCRVFNFGLGDQSGMVKLYDARNKQSGSSHASLHADVISDIHHQEVDSVDVEIKTLDEVSDELGVHTIDFLKIDTEGHELAVLKGAERLLSESRIGVVHFEFNEMNVISRSFMRDFVEILEGYRLFRLLPNSLLEIAGIPVLNEIFGFQNIVAIKQDHVWLERSNRS